MKYATQFPNHAYVYEKGCGWIATMIHIHRHNLGYTDRRKTKTLDYYPNKDGWFVKIAKTTKWIENLIVSHYLSKSPLSNRKKNIIQCIILISLMIKNVIHSNKHSYTKKIGNIIQSNSSCHM